MNFFSMNFIRKFWEWQQLNNFTKSYNKANSNYNMFLLSMMKVNTIWLYNQSLGKKVRNFCQIITKIMS